VNFSPKNELEEFLMGFFFFFFVGFIEGLKKSKWVFFLKVANHNK
jgi:hypothetical protein